ncbi:MAG: hypothetical protein FJW66_01105 [Actinobacteria bacterium]|nr:hypothetical protein [Actinomycetota bacterium]
MKNRSNKKIFFYILSLLTIVTFLSLAALCNQCSISNLLSGITTASGEISEITGDDNLESDEQNEQTGNGENTVTDEDAESEEAEDEGEEVASEPDENPENQPPVINSIYLVTGDDREEIDDSITAIGKMYYDFIMEATDAENEDLTHDASCSGGMIIHSEQVDNNYSRLVWTAESEGNYSITFIVRDGSNETTRTVNVDIDDVATEFVAEPFQDLCGHIVKDTMIYDGEDSVLVGDDGAGRQVKGYLSFDISMLSGDPDSEVLMASLRCDSCYVDISGDLSFAEKLDIKAFDYGNSLDMGDFAVGGTLLISIPADGLSRIDFVNPGIADTMNSFIDNEKRYYQLKLGFDVAADSDTVIDGIWIPVNDLYINGLYH